MKRKMLLLLLCTWSLVFCGCSRSYNQSDVDTMAVSYENTIAELESKIDELQTQISVLQNKNDELLSFSSVPAGMSDAIYSYGITVYKQCNSYIDKNITALECCDVISEFMTDLILGNTSNLGPVDAECYDNIVFCYSTIKRIAKEDFSEYSLEQLLYALDIKIEELSIILGL